MAFYSAKNARVQINGVNLYANKWTIQTKVDELDVSNFEGGGYTQWIGGLLDADISFDCIWDSVQADPLTTVPPGLQTGTVVGTPNGPATVCRFYLDRAGAVFNANAYWGFSAILITQVEQDAEVRGFLRYSVRAKNAGTFAFPTF